MGAQGKLGRRGEAERSLPIFLLPITPRARSQVILIAPALGSLWCTLRSAGKTCEGGRLVPARQMICAGSLVSSLANGIISNTTYRQQRCRKINKMAKATERYFKSFIVIYQASLFSLQEQTNDR